MWGGGFEGGEGDEHTGGGSTLGAGWWDVFREGGVGGSWTVFHIDETFVYACATQEQGPRVCRKVGGIIGGSCCGKKQ